MAFPAGEEEDAGVATWGGHHRVPTTSNDGKPPSDGQCRIARECWSDVHGGLSGLARAAGPYRPRLQSGGQPSLVARLSAETGPVK